MPKFFKLSVLAAVVGAFVGMAVVAGSAQANGVVSWNDSLPGHQGTSVVNGQRILASTVCDPTSYTSYIHWVLTATGATSAQITINGSTFDMVKKGNGAFHFDSTWYNLNTVVASASYVGDSNNVQLVISHGCPPRQLLWCSPGFWSQNYAKMVGTAYELPASILDTTFPGGGNYTLRFALANPSVVKGGVFNAAGNYISAYFGWNGTQATGENCPINSFGVLKVAPILP